MNDDYMNDYTYWPLDEEPEPLGPETVTLLNASLAAHRGRHETACRESMDRVSLGIAAPAMPWSDPDHDVSADLRDAAAKAIDDYRALLREHFATPPGYPVPRPPAAPLRA